MDMRALLTAAASAALWWFAAPCAAQGARFELSADTILVDQEVEIALTGLPPGARVTVRLAPLGNADIRATAIFQAGADGRLELARTAPISGDYSGVHAMGLFWSGQRDSAAGPLPPPGVLRSPEVPSRPPQGLLLTAEVEGRIAAVDTVWRIAVAPGVRITPIRERGIVGTLYTPPGPGRHPAAIVLGGSLGGITPPNGPPGGLASHGYTVLALGYFGAEGLPEYLANIPLEYFDSAIRWLAEQPSVDPERIAIVGTSRGAEAALLIAATYSALHAVVAYAPSNVVWPGVDRGATRPVGWTLGGKPVPRVLAPATPEAVARHAGCPDPNNCKSQLVHSFLARLDDAAAAARAEIPVERINGPVLLISGQDDAMWPSPLMAERVVARLRRHGFRFPVEHLSYPGAGHGIGRPYTAQPGLQVTRPHAISGVPSMPGGERQATALASEDSWGKMLDFLDRNLARR